ncbi:Phosphomevalonate kinase [Candidatus Gugararchaeum adminiculabundum]|nr:Phosphomevalonate kinase [Candidatus Gugararchaeum adminiculabundum]
MDKFSAPGKILLLGGYSVLEKGNVGYVIALDRRVRASAEAIDGGIVEIEMPQFNISASGEFDTVGWKIKLDSADEWQAQQTKFARACIENTLRYYASKGKKVRGIRVTAQNDEGFTFKAGTLKSGFGSSAAATVSMTFAIADALGVDALRELRINHRLAQYSHSSAQGKVGSGFDVACSTFGTIKWQRYSPEFASGEIPQTIDKTWDCNAEKVALPPGWILEVGFTGKSASTSSMVKQLYEFKAKEPDAYSAYMKKINGENLKAISALDEIGKFAKNDPKEYEKALAEPASNPLLLKFHSSFVSGRELLKELGEKSGVAIEPQELSGLIEIAEGRGAFCAKLPGAGGGDSVVAICFSKEGQASVRSAWKKLGITPIDVSASSEGVKKDLHLI